MKYSTEEAKEKLIEMGREIHNSYKEHKKDLEKKIKEVHRYIEQSDLTYTESFIILKGIYDEAEFNEGMQRVRNTIWKRDGTLRKRKED